MKLLRVFRSLRFLGLVLPAFAVAAPVHVWEKQELTFTAEKTYANPYLEVVVWVDLSGPGFNKRVYGFWDGGATRGGVKPRRLSSDSGRPRA